MVRRTLGAMLVSALVVATLLASVLPAAAQSEGRIAGIVYADKNGNGIREQGEEGVKDARLTFETGGGWSTTINSADDGSFSINLNPATWRVTITPPPGYNTPQNPTVEVVLANAGDAVTNLEFGLVPEGTVLPASGGFISEQVVIGGLVLLLVIGVALIIVGQHRRQALA